MAFGGARAVVCILPFVGFAIGHYLDVQETERMTLFRDKSALYGRRDDDEQNKDKPPSWWKRNVAFPTKATTNFYWLFNKETI